MTKIDFDFSQVRELTAAVEAAPERISPRARQAVEVAARKTKDRARELTSGSKYLPHLPGSIEYDMLDGNNSISAEVGFERSKTQGKLGNIYEYGSRYFPARGPLTQAIHEQEADFVRGMSKAAEDAARLL